MKNKKIILSYILYFILIFIAIYILGIGIDIIIYGWKILTYTNIYYLLLISTINPLIISGIILFFLEKNKRKVYKLNEELINEKIKYKEILDFLPIFVYETDKYGNITHANEFAKEELGYSDRLESGELNFADIIQPQDVEKATKALYKRLLGRLEDKPREYILIKENGEKLKCLLRSSAIVDDNGIIGTRGVVLDITEKTILEKKYIDKSKFLNDIINLLPAPLEYRKADGTFVFVNQAY